MVKQHLGIIFVNCFYPSTYFLQISYATNNILHLQSFIFRLSFFCGAHILFPLLQTKM